MVQDNTDNNVQDLKNQLQAEQRRNSRPQGGYHPNHSDLMRPAVATSAVCPGPGLHPGDAAAKSASAELTPEQQQEQQLAAKDRELAYNARFASNIAYSRPPDPQPGQEGTTAAGFTTAG